MKSIKINLSKTEDNLFGQSKWWGTADLPEGVEYPMVPYEDGDDDPLTLVCQIRCADLAEIDKENLLPHEGMLYFFADINEYVHALDDKDNESTFEYDKEVFIEDEDYCNSMGEWSPEAYRVIYCPSAENLASHDIVNSDGSPAYLPAEKITFEGTDFDYDSFKLLGLPYYEEIKEWYPDYINLLQIDENDDWQMILYDCGMINFLIHPEDLKARRFSEAIVYFHSL